MAHKQRLNLKKFIKSCSISMLASGPNSLPVVGSPATVELSSGPDLLLTVLWQSESISRRIQHLTNLADNGFAGKGLLKEENAGPQHPVMNNGVFGVP